MFDVIDSAVSHNMTGDGFTRKHATRGAHMTFPKASGGAARVGATAAGDGDGEDGEEGEDGEGGGGGEGGAPPASLRATCSVDLSELADQVRGHSGARNLYH